MPIVGFNFKSINAHIGEEKPTGNIDIKSAPTIESIKKRDLKIQGMKDVLSIEFTFETKYEPSIGSIVIKGEVLYQTDDADAKKILSMWKDKRLEPKAAVEILNPIFKKCLTRAVSIADELRLPPPLTFPAVKIEQPKKGGTAS